MGDETTQTRWMVVFVLAAGAFFYFGSEILMKHTDWGDFKTPPGVGEIFGLFASVSFVVAAALNIDILTFINRLRSGRN